jgi:hypothetical protein
MRVTKISLVEVLVALNRTASPLRTLALTQVMQPSPAACSLPPMGEGAFPRNDVAPYANRSNFRSCVWRPVSDVEVVVVVEGWGERGFPY